MRVAEAIELMTKAMLQRVVDSFTKDFPKPDEERAREIILRNTGELTDRYERIEAVLQFDGRLQDQIRQTCVLEALIGSPDCSASELDVVERVTQLQQEVLDAAASPQALRYEDARSVEVLRAVMRVAIGDAVVTTQEAGTPESASLKAWASLSSPCESSRPSWSISPGKGTCSTALRNAGKPYSVSNAAGSSSIATALMEACM